MPCREGAAPRVDAAERLSPVTLALLDFVRVAILCLDVRADFEHECVDDDESLLFERRARRVTQLPSLERRVRIEVTYAAAPSFRDVTCGG